MIPFAPYASELKKSIKQKGVCKSTLHWWPQAKYNLMQIILGMEDMATEAVAKHYIKPCTKGYHTKAPKQPQILGNLP